MKLTDREKMAIAMLRALDSEQRNKLLADIKRVALANKIITQAGRKAGALKRVRSTPDHKVVGAFGTLPTWRGRSRSLDPD